MSFCFSCKSAGGTASKHWIFWLFLMTKRLHFQIICFSQNIWFGFSRSGQYHRADFKNKQTKQTNKSPLPVAEWRLSKLQYLDRTPLIPPPPHTTPLLSESEPGESPELPLLLQFSPLCAPLDSLGHCWVLMQAGKRESQGLCSAGGGNGQSAV